MGKIGLGIITYKRPQSFQTCYNSVCNITELSSLVVVDDSADGNLLEDDIPSAALIRNEINLGVGKSKNKALRYLLDAGCDHIFLMEDDMVVKDPSVFRRYVDASKRSGIQHFNYGPGSPFNRKQNIQFDLHNRHLLDQKSSPAPRLTIDYGDGCVVELYEHTVAMFSYYSKEVIELVGFIDENYHNAWEHVDHTYEIIKAGYHPPFWYFADIHNSNIYIEEQENAISDSVIASNTTEWTKNVMGGREIYKTKHGHYPNQPPYESESDVFNFLKKVKP